jgi:hypothetical protein
VARRVGERGETETDGGCAVLAADLFDGDHSGDGVCIEASQHPRQVCGGVVSRASSWAEIHPMTR